jgi:hypothetical protein
MKTKIPLRLTRGEADEIERILALVPQLTASLDAAAATIAQLTTQVISPGDRVIRDFSQRCMV